MAVPDERIAGGDTGDDVARLVALTERQHELWALLREAKDESVRNQLFDELTANREQLAEIKAMVSAQVDDPAEPESEATEPPPGRSRSVGEELRANLLTPEEPAPKASAPPPPPPTRPSSQTPPPPPSAPAIETELTPEEPQPDPVSAEPTPPIVEPGPAPELDPTPSIQEPQLTKPEPEPELPRAIPDSGASADPMAGRHTPTQQDLDALKDPDRLAPEKTPFASREADLAATRGVKPEPVSPVAPVAPEDPASVADGILEERRRLAHEAYQEMERVRPEHSRSFPVFAILVAIVAVAAVAWYLLIFQNDDGGTDGSPATTTTLVEGQGETTAVDAQIQAVVDGLGVGSIMVEQRDGTLFLIGTVDSDADRSAVIGATEALAGDLTIDAERLLLSAADEELRAAVLQAIAEAGYDKVNVAVSGGVATLTGVTPEQGTAELVAAVNAVEGIAQVVDLTESSDRAAALDNELNRITAVTPLVFESGQIDLNTLQERILDSAAEIILAYNGPVVTIVGYTDAAGTTEENEQISLLRGSRVRDYLVAQGVPTDRLVVEGRGESDATGSSAVAGLERRVEFEVGYAVPAGGNADFRIGIVAPSARNDLAFTQSIVDAANVIALERGGVGIDISDGLFVPEDAEAALRSYAAEGYDLVIAHGSQYGTSLVTLAPEFPGTAFAWGTAADTFGLPNVSAYEVAADEGGYVMGAIAAALTESNVIGVVGPLEVGDAQLFVDGFTSGVTATNASIDVLTTYTGSFGDVGLAAEAADAHISAGADVLTGSAQMVVGAVGVATESDVVWFGNQANQTELAPDLVVASQVYHWEVALRQIVTGLDQGVLGGSTYTLNLANGGVIIEYNPGYILDSAVSASADAVTEAIIAGTIVTGS